MKETVAGMPMLPSFNLLANKVQSKKLYVSSGSSPYLRDNCLFAEYDVFDLDLLLKR